MPIRRASLIQPYRRPEDFPTHLTGANAAELLNAATALWHPALIHLTGSLPGARPADDLPDPTEFEGELLILPMVSRQRLSADWCDRFRTTVPNNAPPVDAVASRTETIGELLAAAGLSDSRVDPDIVADFLALGFAHLQVELLTRAMHYSSVLDSDQFESAVVAAAAAAVAGNIEAAREELARAFDLLADARNHVYSVDFYVVDVTLVADSTLGENLQQKLAAGSPTSVLISGELLDKLASQHPETRAELQRALESETACLIGGTYHDPMPAFSSPEELLAELTFGRQAVQRHLSRDYHVFAQFHANLSPLTPETLKSAGFRGALHAAFDGTRLPQSDQRKTLWGPGPDASIETLAAIPRDIAQPETWLKFAHRIADTIAHDHVATILLAGWPGVNSAYYDDLRRAARYGPVLGRLVTLEEYFKVSREVDEWTTFNPREYAPPAFTATANPISSNVTAYRRDVLDTHERLTHGLTSLVEATESQIAPTDMTQAVIVNPWNFQTTKLVGIDPLSEPPAVLEQVQPVVPRLSETRPLSLPEVPASGFATVAAAAPVASIALADGHTLRNERLEITVSESSGGIQSLRTHRDRGNRASQRLVYQQGSTVSMYDTQMVADGVSITRNDALVGEITSRGQLLDSSDILLARFTQRVRIVRGLSAAIVDVELEPKRELGADIWRSYIASRLAVSDEAIAVRRGRYSLGDETGRERIESPEWIEIHDGIGAVTCFAFGLPFHRRASTRWLDTLLHVAGESERHFHFAIAIDEAYPARAALGLLTAGQTPIVQMPEPPNVSRGWFLHIAAKNILMTHLEPLLENPVGGVSDADYANHRNMTSASETPPTSTMRPARGLRMRLLETEGRDVQTTLSAFRQFRAARTTDFRGNSTAVLSVNEGRIDFEIRAHRWIQIEAEFDSR
jgi:alpha-mannosidase